MEIPKDIKLKKLENNFEVLIKLRNPITVKFFVLLIIVSFFAMIGNIWLGVSGIVFCSLLIWFQLSKQEKLILSYDEIRLNGAVYRFEDIQRIYVKYEQTEGSFSTAKGRSAYSFIVLEYSDSLKKKICDDMILDYQKVVARILKKLKSKNYDYINSIFDSES